MSRTLTIHFLLLNFSGEKFAKLQKAKEILSDENKRKDYDHWRGSGLAIDYSQWVAKKDSLHTVSASLCLRLFLCTCLYFSACLSLSLFLGLYLSFSISLSLSI